MFVIVGYRVLIHRRNAYELQSAIKNLMYYTYLKKEKVIMANNISYHNKDAISKVFAEKFPGKSLKVYGINAPKVVAVLPTNLPEISANELRIDNLFLLEDGTIAIVDYESDYGLKNRNKYINYIARVLKRYENAGEYNINLRMIVIYTADVTRDKVKSEHNLGAMTLKVEDAFLSEIDSDEVKTRLTNKIANEELLTDEEVMEFIILPLTYKDKERKQFAIKESFELAKSIKDDDTLTFVLIGLLVFTDKIIDENLEFQIKEWIMMTKVGRLFEIEKEEALAQKDVIIAEKDAENAAIVAEKEEAIRERNDALARIKELESKIAAMSL